MNNRTPSSEKFRQEAGDSLIVRILSYLRERKFEPGDRLPGERQFADKLGVGRNTLREALASLITLRVLEARPNSGVYLRDNPAEASFETFVLSVELGIFPDPNELTDAMEVRETLELTAVRLACQRRTDADLEKLRDVHRRVQQTLEEEGNIADLDDAFHVAVVEASHNDVLLRILNGFYRLSIQRRRIIFAKGKYGRRSARMHSRLVTAIAKRDEEAATAIMREHLNMGFTYWKEVLQVLPRHGN